MGRSDYDNLRRCAAGLDGLNGGLNRLCAGVARLESGITRLEAGVTRLEAGVARLEAGVARLQEGQEQIFAALYFIGGCILGILAAGVITAATVLLTRMG